MNVARLLQDSPSDDHRRRQELREKHEREKERGREREDDRERERERERERDRERERGREHEWDRGRERGREWGRERERAQRERSSMPSKPTAPPPTHRSYSPLGSTLPPQSRIHAYDSKPPLPPPPPRAAPTPNQNQNHAFPHSPGSDTMHARSYSQEGRPSSSAHSQMQAQAQSHSPPAPLFLSPLTAPREGTGGAAAGPEPETAPNNTSPEYSVEYAHRAKNAPQQTQGKTPPMFSRLERDREREYQQRTRSLSGSARPRTPPYGDYRDAGRVTPTTARSGPGKHSPAQGSYSVVPPSQQSHQQHHFSPPLSGSLNNNNSSLHRAHPSQGPPLARRPAPPPASLPPPPSASLKHSHDSSGAPTTSAMGRPFDELPYPARAPSSSSSVMNAAPRERERTLKEDIERERESLERERREKERERERERVRGREMQRNASSRSASTGASVHASPPNAFGDRVGELERDMVDIERMNREDMDAIRAAAATRMQSQPRDARERDAPRHHHHHHHHHALSHPHLHSHSSPNVYSQHQHQQQQQLQSHLPGTPYTYAHTGKPRISRSGVLKLAPPGVTVPNNVPPSSSDLIFAGASGVVMRAETLTLAPASHSHGSQQQQQTPPALSALSGPQPIEPISVNVKQPSPPTTSLHLPLEMYSEGSQAYEGPQGYVEGPHSLPHLQQHPQQSSKHKSYSVVPTGPGVPPPNGGPPPPTNVQASMIAAQQQQQQQQHAQQFGSMSTHQQMHRSHPHQQSLPPPPQSHPSSSSNGMHSQGPNHPHLHSSPYRHTSSGMPPQHQGYPPPPMHYNEVPPPPVPMALQPMPASSPMQELPPEEATLHLGTFVFPHTPFPYFFPSRGDSDSRRVTAAPNLSPGQARKNARREADLATEHRERPTHVTIRIPSSHLPSSLPTDGRPRIWGGTPSSAPAPWAAYTNFVTRPHTAVAGARRVYTDDSDILLCALHSGRVSWAGMRRARAAGLDLAVRLALHRDVGRYVGAPSAFADGSAAEGVPDVDVGLRCLLDGKSAKEVYEDTHLDNASWLMAPSASWESGHDGSGIEVLSAEWIPHGSTRKLGLRNRSQRLREYTERRRVIMKEVPADNLSPVPGPSTTVLGKRPARRSDPSCNSLSKDEEEISAARTVVFGTCREAESVGFKYDPTTIQSILFPSSSFSSSLLDRPRGRRKRRKLNGTNGVNGRTDPYSDADTESEFVSGNAGNNRKTSLSPRRSGIANTNTNRDVVLENGEARFLLALHDTHERSEEDKENRDSSVGSTDGSAALRKGSRGKRYDLYALPAFSSLPVPPVSIDRPIPPKNMSATNGSGHARTDVETPMTPKSNGSECGAGKSLKAVVDAEVTHENDAAEATTAAPNGTTSEPSAKTVAIPTPPATTETVHAPSPPPRSIDAAKDKGEYTKVPQILYRDLCAENVQFLDSGLSIAGAGRILENGAEKERKGMLIPVERWRWSGSRDSITARSGSGREDIAGLGVS